MVVAALKPTYMNGSPPRSGRNHQDSVGNVMPDTQATYGMVQDIVRRESAAISENVRNVVGESTARIEGRIGIMDEKHNSMGARVSEVEGDIKALRQVVELLPQTMGASTEATRVTLAAEVAALRVKLQALEVAIKEREDRAKGGMTVLKVLWAFAGVLAGAAVTAFTLWVKFRDTVP